MLVIRQSDVINVATLCHHNNVSGIFSDITENCMWIMELYTQRTLYKWPFNMIVMKSVR